jgi:hypothetical protein
MKRYLITCSVTLLLVFAIRLWANPIPAGTETIVEEIMANQDSYDGKQVSVLGTVSTPRFKAARHGKPYMTFPLLGESGGRINIFVWGTMKLKQQQKIRVTGTYKKLMKMGKYTFRDAIEAGRIEKK